MEYHGRFWFLAALIPLVVGAVWYHPKVLGTAWMKSIGITEADLQGSNMALIFGLTYVLSLFIAVGLTPIVIHQSGIFSLFAEEYAKGDVAIKSMVDGIMTTYGDKHRHFGHGALHGGIAAIMMALPIIGIVALFERRSWKYVAIHAGYWFLSFVLMGGLICQFV